MGVNKKKRTNFIKSLLSLCIYMFQYEIIHVRNKKLMSYRKIIIVIFIIN